MNTTLISPSGGEIASVLGIKINNVSVADALKLMISFIEDDSANFHSVFFVNTHTLNLAKKNYDYQNVLNSANTVFGDGTGVRWAAKLHGITLKANLAGTDIVPLFLKEAGNLAYRYFLLGGQPNIINSAAAYASRNFLGCEMVGFHHGHFDHNKTPDVIEKINAARPHFLLVGMGNPQQELWISKYSSQLRIPLAIGVGGLFHYWAGDIKRSPLPLRTLGMEWLGILCQQPHKWNRYLVGNLEFIFCLIKLAKLKNIPTISEAPMLSGSNSNLESLSDI